MCSHHAGLLRLLRQRWKHRRLVCVALFHAVISTDFKTCLYCHFMLVRRFATTQPCFQPATFSMFPITRSDIYVLHSMRKSHKLLKIRLEQSDCSKTHLEYCYIQTTRIFPDPQSDVYHTKYLLALLVILTTVQLFFLNA